MPGSPSRDVSLNIGDMYGDNNMIAIDEIKLHPEQWIDTSYLRSDGKIEYREKKEYGNRHAIFNPGAYWGSAHIDQHNATDVPIGTVKHFSNYVEEKTGVPQGLVALGAIAATAFVGYKIVKWADKNL